MPVTSARRMNPEIIMATTTAAVPGISPVLGGTMPPAAGLWPGWTKEVARPVARSIARRTGRPEAQILSLIGGVFLAIALIDFLREVDAVIAAGRPPASQ